MNRPPGSDAPAPEGDPWAAFGYLVAGVACYGALGWGLSIWLHAEYWIPIGILVGIGLGMYMVFARYRFREPTAGPDTTEPMLPAQQHHSALQPEAPQPEAARRPERNDRGDTA